MKDVTFLASKERKVFLKKIQDEYGVEPSTLKAYAFMQRKDKIYAISRDVELIDFEKLRINSMGVYIAELKKDQLRFSIEGSQLIGPLASKNVFELDDEQVKQWFKGEDIPVESDHDWFVILKHRNDYVGSGRIKEGVLFNFVPKARRLLEIH